MNPKPIYLDYASSTPLHSVVRDALYEYLSSAGPGNASSTEHAAGQSAARAIHDARKKVASASKAAPEAVVFTSGATESNNLCILGLANYGERAGKRHILSTQIEHKAVLEPLKYLSTRGFEVEFLRPNSGGQVQPQEIKKRLRNDTLLVSVMHVNNETGVIQPIREIAEVLAASDAYFHVDSAQGFLKDQELQGNSRIDFISISGHKIFGPQGVGALIAPSGTKRMRVLRPVLFGGGQERGLRPGTQPVALIVALGVAVQHLWENSNQWRDSCLRIQQSLLAQINTIGAKVNGDTNNMIPSILNFQLPGVDADAFLLANKDKLMAARGSACTTGSMDTSHVLKAMGLRAEEAERSVRFSWGPDTPTLANTFLKDALSEFI